MKLGAVILAGGYSSRMKGFKPLMRLGDHTLLRHCVQLFQAAGIERIVVVSGHREQEVNREARLQGAQPLYNPDFDQGMFSSVRRAVPAMADLDGLFMLPVDIPLVRRATLELLMAAFDGRTIAYPCRNGLRGHPPLIPAQLIPAIMEHDGSGGLKRLLARFEGRDVQVWDDGAFMDADTPGDFKRLVRRLEQWETGSRLEAESLAALTMPQRGEAHGRAVAHIATMLARELGRHGVQLDPDLVYNGALLHDLAKGQPDHEARGAAMAQALGLGRLAEVIGAHRDALPVPAAELAEKELVCLADKLVRGTRRMPVEQRFQEKLDLYREDPAACRAIRTRLENALGLKQAVEQATCRPLEDILRETPQP
ncbi:DVU_1551 family NTP transferase [Desulfogranum mediterraneum]|uniref:DVU_1551 family NTP transferase n=1 Tax=Desulfogranum mediterraneum TaxID=160661 RepID=UPI0004227362|nr:NTP transferase domain-containing protein [Desulfogranum mediterraneum]